VVPATYVGQGGVKEKVMWWETAEIYQGYGGANGRVSVAYRAGFCRY
jgi:hypothetical protein